MHLVERFADWAVGFRTQKLTPEVLHHARRAVIDWHAALYPGMVVPPVTLMQKAFAGESESPRLKALIEGTAAHTVEVDDIYRDGIYHPGAPTIAAARALTESLRPVIVGYEISTRIGAAMGRAHYKHWHNTGTIGCFGAAAAAAEALHLSKDQFAHALATVTTFAAGLQQAFRMDSMSKPLHAGRAAEAGVAAALMAREGVTGSLDVMQGFAAAMGDKPDWEKGLATLGKDFHITRMTFKNHACCGHTFAAIDGALEVQKRMQAKPQDIEAVEVATYKAGLEVAHYENPRTPAEGRFSLKYVVATALVARQRAPRRFRAGPIERCDDQAPHGAHLPEDRSRARGCLPRAARGARRDPRARQARGVAAADAHRRSRGAAVGPGAGGQVLRAGHAGAGRDEGAGSAGAAVEAGMIL